MFYLLLFPRLLAEFSGKSFFKFKKQKQEILTEHYSDFAAGHPQLFGSRSRDEAQVVLTVT